MDNTWIKLYRKIVDNEVLHDPNGLKVFIWLLTQVDKKTGKVIIGRFRVSEELRMNPSTFRDTIYRLRDKYKIVDTKSDNKKTEISLSKWAFYNPYGEKTTPIPTTRRQPDDTIQEYKNKEEREIKECQKSLTPCNDVCLWEIGMKLETHMKNVAEKSQDLQDYIEDHPKKYKTFHKTLINWVKGDLRRGYISYLSETERLEMKMDHPDKIAERKKIHDQAIKEGII